VKPYWYCGECDRFWPDYDWMLRDHQTGFMEKLMESSGPHRPFQVELRPSAAVLR
jgi:hypothetical protein